MIKTLNVEAEHNELVLKNNHGDYVIIPADKRDWVKTKLAEGCNPCIDSLVESLPIMDDYAEDGTVVPNEPEKKVKKKIEYKYDKGYPLKDLPYQPNETKVIDDYSPKYNYVIQNDKIYYSYKNKDNYVERLIK